VDDHPFFNGFGAGNDGFLITFHLDKAETTRSRGLCLFLNGTEVGDVDAILQCSPEDGLTLSARDLLIINCQRYVLHNKFVDLPVTLPLSRQGRGSLRGNYSTDSLPLDGGG